MHIGDGVLPAEVWIGGMVAAGAAVGLSLRRFDEAKVPQVAVLTSLFFVGSLLHVRVYPTSVHLLLNSLLGITLGGLCVPGILVALLFQALLLGHGALSTLGVNTLVMSAGALLGRLTFVALRGRGRAVRRSSAAAFVATLAGIGTSGACFLGAMALGSADLLRLASVLLLPYLAIALIEGLVTASTVAFLVQVKPELLEPSRPPSRGSLARALPLAVLGLWALPGAASAHGLLIEARREDGRVRVEAFFSDGAPAAGARVTVLPAGGGKGLELFRGEADAAGIIHFPAEPSVPLHIIVEDGAGHRQTLDFEAGSPAGAAGAPLLASRAPLWLRVLGGIAAISALTFLAARFGRRARRAP